MAGKNIYNQSFWYFKPEAVVPFGMHKGKKIIDILQADFNYLNYCLINIDHFIFSRSVFRYLQKSAGFTFSTNAVEVLGQKMDKADVFLLNRFMDGYENHSGTGSIFKSIHEKGINDILNYKDFFKFVEFQNIDIINENNYQWFDKFFSKIICADGFKDIGVKCTMFLINHGLKNIWIKWLVENWFDSNDGEDLYSFCINILEGSVGVSVIMVIDTRKSLYSRLTTREATSYRGGKAERVTIPARNEYLLPLVDFWRYTLTHDENKQTNWIINLLNSKAKESYGQEIFLDGKSTSSKILAHKSVSAFYLEDDDFTHLVENYYTKIKRNDFLDRRRKSREEADYEALLDPVSDNDDDFNDNE